MANKKRNHSRYELRDGHEVVYVGITKQDPNQRAQQHTSDGKKFTSINVVGPAVTKDSAEGWEEERLQTYRNNHGGKNPRHNKTSK